MPATRIGRAAFAALALTLAVGSAASAGTPARQHGSSARHLPAVHENLELVAKLELSKQFGNVVDEQIADVAVHKGFAYLMSWGEETCTRGGTYVVDIRNPAAPREVGFVAAPAGSYHGEGAHAITLNTSAFKGELLAVNNEPCADGGPGGFDLIDVTAPTAPKVLAAGVGDTGGEGELTGDSELPNSAHSIFIWQAGTKAFAVLVDNLEDHDVDIFDITNPASPAPVAEYDFDGEEAGLFGQIVDSSALGTEGFLHDMVVKQIGGRHILLASYWDSGYVMVDVTDPGNPTYIGDTSFDGPDPLTGMVPPEGNAHQAEFSHDNRYFLAADEDFAPYRPESFAITTGPDAGEFPAADVGGGTSVAFLRDGKLNGPVVYGGYGCPVDPNVAGSGSDPIPPRSDYPNLGLAPGEEAIIVLQRGPANDPDNTEPACFPGEKAANGIAAGWDAVLLVNRHFGDADDDEPFCGSGAFPADPPIVALCTTHEAFHLMFGSDPEFGTPVNPALEPDVGDVGERVEATAVFDGWGYAHLYETGTGKLRQVDAFAIDEGLDPRYAFGFGDLSIHEFATDPTESLAYSSYYAGGARVFAFGPSGLEQVGKFIDEGGNNFWGVEQFTTADGERLLALSDRDFGLYLLRYTGPGAPRRPVCADSQVTVAEGASLRIPLLCTDANGNPLTLSIASPPQRGSLGAIVGGAVTYTARPGVLGTDSFTYTASDGAALAAPARVTVSLVAGPLSRRCLNRIIGSAANDILTGTSLADTILGGRGDDRIAAGPGDDCVAGEEGNDQIAAGDGNDSAEGGSGGDRVSGDTGNDALRGNAGRDDLRGGSGADRLRGDSGNDSLRGGAGNDALVGGAGNDSLRGESGNDRIRGDAGSDVINAGSGSNRISGGSGNDRINAVNGRRDRVSCGAGRDRVRADRADRVARSCESVSRRR